MRGSTYCFTLRLGAKDLDIIALSETDNFINAAKSALKAFVSGKRFTFPMPKELPRTNKTKERIHLRFYEEDSSVVDFLNTIGEGNKNAIVLSIIRSSFPFPVVSPYLDDDGVYYDLFIRKGKRGRKKKSVLSPDSPAKDFSIQEKPSHEFVLVTPAVETKQTEGVIAEKEVIAPRPAEVITPPVRPSLVEAVEEEQKAEEITDEEGIKEQTETNGNSTDSSSEGFDPFALGADMMNSF